MDTMEPLHVDPDRGLSAQQVQDRLDAGLHGGTAQGAGLSEREIILRHCLTFFNFIFIFLAVLLLIGRSSPKNMGFLGVVIINTVIGIVQEIRAKRAVEKLSLVARFGVTIYFGKPDKKQFQEIVRELAKKNGIDMLDDELLLEANKWELSHGGLSGRTAQQFIDYLAGTR